MFWNQAKHEKENEKLDASVTDFVEAMGNLHLLRRAVYLSLAANLMIWIFSLILSDKIIRLSNFLGGIASKPVTIAVLIPFFLGFILAYSIFRIKFPDFESKGLLDSEFMSSIDYQQNSNRKWLIWLSSISIGMANAMLLIIAISIINGI